MNLTCSPQLSGVTIQPVLFTLLFVYVFGAGVVLPGGGSYTDFAIAGLLALNLPMWRAAVLVGRSLADLSTAVLCTVIGHLRRPPPSSTAAAPPAERRGSAAAAPAS